MPIAFNCSECGAKYRVKDEMGGKKIRCGKCQAVVLVPFADPVEAFEPVQPPPMPQSKPPALQPIPKVKAAASRDAFDFAPPSRSGGSKSFGGGIGTLKIPERLNVKIAACLLLLMVASIAYLMYCLGAAVAKQFPDQLYGRVWILVGVTGVFTVVQQLLIVPVVAWVCVQAAASITKWRVLDPAFFLVAGAMACPVILMSLAQTGLAADLAAAEGRRVASVTTTASVLGMMLLGTLITAGMLQGLLHLNWRTTFLSWLFVGPATTIALYLLGTFVQPHIETVAQKISGITKESVEQWAKEHPDEIKAFRESKFRAQPAAVARGSGNSGSNPTAVESDPLAGKADQLQSSIREFQREIREGYREDLKARLESLEKELAALKPAGSSPIWDSLNSRIQSLRDDIAAAPSRELPAYVFQKPVAKEAEIAKLLDSELSPQFKAFGLSFRVPATYKVQLKQFDSRENELQFSVDSFWGPTISIKPLKKQDGKQEQPLFYSDDRVARVAGEKGVVAIKSKDAKPRVMQVNGQTVFEVDGGSVYVVQTSDGWAVLNYQGRSGQAENSLKLINLLPTISTDLETAVDPYSPEQLLTRIADESGAVADVFKKMGEQGIPALKNYLETHIDTPGRPALVAALKEMGVELASAGSTGSPSAVRLSLDAGVALERYKSSTGFAKRDALKELASAKIDESKREEIAKLLEQEIMSDDAWNHADDIGAALAVWNRPQTVTVLLPMIANEKMNSFLRKPVIKVMAATKDKKAPQAVLRWIIKEPDAVVEAAISMGTMVEDEALKLLAEKDANVRRNAARILLEVGTRKSMGALLRASKDQRDASAAATAQAAYQMVKDRAATQPATTAPAR